TSYVTIENFGVTADSSDSSLLKGFKIERKWRESQNTITIKGGLKTQSPQKVRVIEIVEPALYFGTLFSELLADEKIALNGNIIKGTSPDTNLVLVEHLSEPLSSLITKNNKDSDNLYAELILKTLGAEEKGKPGTAEKGISVIKQFFNEMGVDTTSFGLADGSGVSRYNVISPDQIIELLKAMYKDFRLRAEFVASLAIAGVDGTLRNRMKNTSAQGKLRAKTGTIRGTSALSGYTTTADGEPVAFSIIMEHFVKPTSAIRKLQDQIGVILSSFSNGR
ncbi:D-alanyl-D-alanine carboxypeptidase/D-alanyl-D-alanine-endopeptidase, partial [candidate division KSB1 bacterium]|nr:D-alanyl-D-alanine carboxypeptidase/D-alanyl-D-alanine-endopeptidase [candidate division KSB1 bacterium]